MKPAFRVSIDKQDVTSLIADRLISLRVTDEAGQKADTCEISIDDRDKKLELPPDGASVVVEMGYEGGELVLMGSFLIDEVSLGNGPRGMSIRAVATPSGSVTGSSPVKGGSLLGYIYGREGGYDSFNREVAGDSPGSYPGGLQRLTIGQVMDLQAQGKVSAVGAPQFIRSTLPIAMRDAGLSRSDLFSAENQDRMAMALLTGTKRPSLAAYLKGSSDDITAAQQDLCQEFAGIVCPSGVGFYDGQAGNQASGTVADVQAALRAARGEIGEATPAVPLTPAPALGERVILESQRLFLKEKRTQSWHDTTLGEIAAEIARRNSLELEIKGELGSIIIRHEDQTTESDAHFLTRLADDHKAVMKPSEGKLLIAPRGRASLGGRVELKETDVSTWSAQLKDRARFSEVQARWLDRKTSQEKVVSAKGKAGFPTHVMNRTFKSEKAAQKAAAAKLQSLTAGAVDVSITMIGRPTISAEGEVVLSGFHPSIDDEPWIIKSVSHEISRSSGFVTSLNCGTPGEDVEQWGSGAGLFPGGPTESGTYVQGSIGPTSTGPHFDIKRQGGAYFSRTELDQFVEVNGEPLSRGTTVKGGEFGASRSYGSHNGWDFAFSGSAALKLKNGAKWVGVTSTSNGDKATFRTPDGRLFEILHGRFRP